MRRGGSPYNALSEGCSFRLSRSAASSLGSKEPRIVAFEQYGRGLEGPRAAQHISSPLVRPRPIADRPGGGLLRAVEPFRRWFPGFARRIRSRVLRRLPGRALRFLARRFLLFGVQFLGHRQRPHLGIVPHALVLLRWIGSAQRT